MGRVMAPKYKGYNQKNHMFICQHQPNSRHPGKRIQRLCMAICPLLVLLASAVVAVVACRRLGLPALLVPAGWHPDRSTRTRTDQQQPEDASARQNSAWCS